MFTQEQIKELSNNKNVAKCGLNSISYSKEFKVWAIRKYYGEGRSPNEIFAEAGFDLSAIGKNRPEQNMKLWRQAHAAKGEKSLLEDNRGRKGGRPKRRRFRNDREKIRYLEAKIKYLDAENGFLAKLRGLKRE